MNWDEIGLLRLRIEAGILLARRRLLAEAREEDRELAVMADGRVVRLRAREMNADSAARHEECDGAHGAEASAPGCPGEPQSAQYTAAARQHANGTR